jgi:hypothetical protein
MNGELVKYLRDQWKLCNIPKYQKYFDEWVVGLTETQIQQYNKNWLKIKRFA